MDLLQTYQSEEFQKLWQQDAHLYRAFGKKLISTGHPTKAFELIREGLSYYKEDLELKYLSALALARGRNISKAEEPVNEILKKPDVEERLRVEALSLVGRLNKDRYERTNQSILKLKFAQESARSYEHAYTLPGDSFPGINAATPVYPYEDKIINRTNFFGSHVNRAARIEPVTTPGCAFTTEQFAALLAVEPGHDFICEYVGVEDLAKGYDRVPLYRLGRRG